MKKSRYRILFLFLALPLSYAHAAGGELYLSPSTGVFQLDQPFTVTVLANTDGAKVNAVEGELAYKPSDLEVEGISIEHAILSTWSTSPAYDGAAGIIKFSGWAGHAYSGKDGLLATITFRARKVGQSSVTFNSGAMLAADGRGSNIITTMTAGNYTVSPKQVTPAAADVPTSTPATATPEQQNVTSELPAAGDVHEQDQSASVISSGIELAPVLVPFFAALVLIAFCIAYVLHRKGAR